MASKRAAIGGGRERQLTETNDYYATTGEGQSWMGPGVAPKPTAPAVEGRAWDFPTHYNQNQTPRAYELIGFPLLRAFADGYDLLRIIIEHRKDQLERLRWVIQPRDPKETMTAQKKNKVKELTKFFLKPDKEHSWNAWLRMILEDLFVIDAVTIHRRKTRGGKLFSLDQIDGGTIKRVLDDFGRTPEDPNETAYQQVLKGMPAVNYTTAEIMYRPRNLRIHKAYGYSPVEQILMTINIALRRQVYQLNFFTEGNIPAALIGVPESWTPDQIRTFQDWFDNILAGNLAEKRKARFVPAAVGKTYVPTQETELFGKAEEWLARVACAAFSVSPQPFLMMMNRATADTAQEQAAADGMFPIQNWVKSIIDDILAEDMDAADYEFVWRGDDELDPVRRQQITSGYLKDGLITINEGRADMGREPYEDEVFNKPMAITSNGLAPLIGPGSQLQGGGKVPEVPQGADGKGLDVDEGPNSSVPKPVAEETVKKISTLQAIIDSGDDELIKFYLNKIHSDVPSEDLAYVQAELQKMVDRVEDLANRPINLTVVHETPLRKTSTDFEYDEEGNIAKVTKTEETDNG